MPDQNQPLSALSSLQSEFQPPRRASRSPLEPVTTDLPFDSETLYEIVESYAGFGPHLTGSEADRRTTDWLAESLERLGADVTLPQFEFQRYICRALLHSDGQEVPCLPVYYSGFGRWETGNVQVIELDRASVAGQATSLNPLIKGPAGNRAVALAFKGPDDQPRQCNRVPAIYGQSTGPGQPAVVIPRNWADRVRADAALSFDGAVETATSRNVVATLGSPELRRVTVTTPLTGWTPCAGERGTGLAAALALALDLSTDHYVVLVGGSGHELDHLGIRNYLSTNNVAQQPVIHLGASVGAVDWHDDGRATLGSARSVMTTAPEAQRPAIARRASAGAFSAADPEDWPGEGGTWREAGASVLSFVGSFQHFHLATDLPDVATTPAAMETATRAVIDTARHFLSGGQR